MKPSIIFVLTIPVVIFLSLLSLVIFFRGNLERDVTSVERDKVVKALKEQDCLYINDVDVEGNYYKAEDVICNDSKKYDIFLDLNLEIVAKKKEIN